MLTGILGLTGEPGIIGIVGIGIPSNPPVGLPLSAQTVNENVKINKMTIIFFIWIRFFSAKITLIRTKKEKKTAKKYLQMSL